MTNQVTTYEFPAGSFHMPVRIILLAGVPWFLLADVCRALDVGSPSHVVRRLDDDERCLLDLSALNSNQGAKINGLGAGNGNSLATFVNEAGLYSVIMTSRKPEAKAFKKWVVSVVLPAIRKDGVYVLNEEKLKDPTLSLGALDQLNDQIITLLRRKGDILEAQVAELEAEKAAITADNDNLRHENTAITAINVVLDTELQMVTVDEWRALNHVYLHINQSQRLGQYASQLARERGIPLGIQERDLRTKNGMKTVKINIYPRCLLDEAATDLGYTFMRHLPRASCRAAPGHRHY
jgi:prophage antirepressor-like protein